MFKVFFVTFDGIKNSFVKYCFATVMFFKIILGTYTIRNSQL